jgi:aconitase B
MRQNTHKALDRLLPLLLLLAIVAGAAEAMEGWKLIMSGRAKYDDADFQGAIRDFQSALGDPTLVYIESTSVYFSLAACNAKLQRAEGRDEYLKKILLRKVRPGFREGQGVIQE